MTRSQCKELLPTLQRWCEGETLQVNPGSWLDVEENLNVSFTNSPEYYRIKPKPHVVWLSVLGMAALKIVVIPSKNTTRLQEKCGAANSSR